MNAAQVASGCHTVVVSANDRFSPRQESTNADYAGMFMNVCTVLGILLPELLPTPG